MRQIVRKGDSYRMTTPGRPRMFVWGISSGIVELRSYDCTTYTKPLPSIKKVELARLLMETPIETNHMGTVVYVGPEENERTLH